LTGTRGSDETPRGEPITGTPIALVTGATPGPGRAVAGALAGHGMHILVHGRDSRRAAAVVNQISKSGGTAQAVLADLASLDHVRELADRITADHNAITLLINNAGIARAERPIAGGNSARTVTNCGWPSTT